MSIKFFYAPQSNADRVHASLAVLGVPYDEVRIDIRAGDTRKPEFLAVNPNGLVPTIILDGTPVYESVAVQIALGERYGVEKGLWPALGSPEHLVALTWLVWGQVTLGGATTRYINNTGDYVPKAQHNAAQAAAALEDIHKRLAILDKHLEGRDFLTGSQLCLADIDLVSVLGWALYMLKLDTTSLPNLNAWLARTQKRIPQRSAS